jgi:basic membrane protein A and related proteins
MTARHRAWAALGAASALLLAAACGSSGSDGGGSGDQKGKVALVVAQGGLGDESYNDLANKGFKEGLEANGLSGSPIESQDVVGQGEQILRRAATSDYGLVIDLEFSHGELLTNVAKDYPKTDFAIVNTESKGDNITSVMFQEQEGSYLAGALAAMMTTQTGNPKINPDRTIGVIGGTKSVGIDKFVVGYMQGARDVDPNTKVLVSYADTFGDPAKGKQLAESMYQQGADIVFHVAGGTGAGVIEAAKSTNHYAIGVDTDQDALAPGYVLTSMIKHTDTAVKRLIEQYAKGEFHGGTTMTLGLKDGGVGLSDFTQTKKDIPADVLSKVDELRQEIVDGQLKVWNVVEQGYPDWFKN